MKINIIGFDAERRAGLKTLLRRVARHAQFIEVENWQQAHAAQKRCKPELIVIDWSSALRVSDLQRLLDSARGVPSAIVVNRPTAMHVFTLMGAGAMGIIPRTLDSVLVLRAFEMVMIGGHYVPPDIIDPNFGRGPRARAAAPKITRPPRRVRAELSLSPRQQQIMRCVHMGSTNKQIAKTLGISEGTVKIHLASIFQLLGAANRAAAVAIYNGVQDSHLEILRDQQEDLEYEEHEEHEEPVEDMEQEEEVEQPDQAEQPAQAAQTEQAEQAQNAQDAKDVMPEESNVVPLRPKHESYPPSLGRESGPIPMAAEPSPSFRQQ